MSVDAVIWIDHHEARLFHLASATADETTVLAPHHHLHRHAFGHEAARQKEDTHRFFKDVARALEGVDALLIVGPASAKLEFFRYLHEHDRRLEAKVIGIESADHPTDGEIVARARVCFAAA
jgi:stalled ribosome rescue protein Dom34